MTKRNGILVLVVLVAAVSSVDLAHALKWCVKDAAEKAVCDAMVGSASFTSQAFSSAVTCEVHNDCETSFLADNVDIWSNVDGGTLYDVSLQVETTVIAGEAYSFSSAVNYYATAVVRASDCASGSITHLKHLKGKRSCHTGYGKSAGWKTPITKLVANDLMEVVVSDDADYPNDMASAAAFFDSSCAPMSTDAMAAKNANTLVKNCGNGAGKAGHGCRGDKGTCAGSDMYYGYDGAFRCLAEGNGDVAFVKHVTVGRNTVGGDNFVNTGDWSWKAESDKQETAWKLICPGSFKCYNPSEYLQCHLSAVPSHAVIAHLSVADADNTRLRTALTNYQGTAAGMAAFFNDGANSEGHMFKSGTKSLVMNTLSTKDYLSDASEVYRGMNLINNAHIGAYNATQQQILIDALNKNDDDDVKIDVLIGVVVGIGVVVLGLVAAVAFIAFREKRGKPVFAALV